MKAKQEYEYMLLSRLQEDCANYLAYGNRNESRLWALSVEAQIAKMKELWNMLEIKPEWCTMEDIERFEREMKNLNN